MLLSRKVEKSYSLSKPKFDFEKLIFIIVMLFPALSHLILFWGGVEIKTIIMAFTDSSTNEFCGLDNFAYVIKQFFGTNAQFGVFLKNTLIYFVIQIVLIPVGMFISYLIYRKMIGSGFVKVVLYLPCAISSILFSSLYIRLLSPNGDWGLLSSWFGIEEQLHDFIINHSLTYMIIYDVWVAIGVNLFIWIGGMSRIPQSVFDAAKIDGIPPSKEFRKIVLPMMWPTFVTMITLIIVGLFGCGGSNLLLGTGPDTYSISYWMYQIVLGGDESNYNLASAAGLFFTLLTIPILVGSRIFLKKHGEAVEY